MKIYRRAVAAIAADSLFFLAVALDASTAVLVNVAHGVEKYSLR